VLRVGRRRIVERVRSMALVELEANLEL